MGTRLLGSYTHLTRPFSSCEGQPLQAMPETTIILFELGKKCHYGIKISQLVGVSAYRLQYMVSVTLATREYLRHLFDTFLWFLCSDESLKPPAQGMQLYILQPQQKKVWNLSR